MTRITAKGAYAVTCAMIEQAYKDATANFVTMQDRSSAKEYLHGPLFEFDMQLLGLDQHVEAIRGMVDPTYQMELKA